MKNAAYLIKLVHCKVYRQGCSGFKLYRVLDYGVACLLLFIYMVLLSVVPIGQKEWVDSGALVAALVWTGSCRLFLRGRPHNRRRTRVRKGECL